MHEDEKHIARAKVREAQEAVTACSRVATSIIALQIPEDMRLIVRLLDDLSDRQAQARNAIIDLQLKQVYSRDQLT